ncbi:hypothetical protein DFH01_08090 [Falsiroseomonas bella]|uniref:Uncharacterized protein n=1 Tax=Falsiroseomonas bella TaxID=2184016 RepID=A0A317FJD6_9PROT|nr:hypothetical protein [Falsiroseomonas bella]PWS39184.1 hypothetical protein DFH01_08090 [Falsiroseomonas bella]
MTAAALRCAGHKDLCARFRAVNPATHFDLDRAEKWFQGRALPRSAHVYDDWAAVLGTSRAGNWLAACSVEDFLLELSRLFDVRPEDLSARIDSRASGAARPQSASAHLCGHYACYSLAWSPYWQGQLIRGAMRIEPGLRRHLPMTATYTETLLGNRIAFRGDALLAARALHIHLREPESDVPLFVSLAMPGPPSSAICGVISGVTLVGPDPRPSAARIVMVRVPGPADASNGYIEPSRDAVSADLAALGLPIQDPAGVDSLVLGFLLPGGVAAMMQVPAAEQAQFAATFDRIYLRNPGLVRATAEPPAESPVRAIGRAVRAGAAAEATSPARRVSRSAGSPRAPIACPGGE